MQFVKPTDYYEALSKLGAKTPIVADMLSSEWADVPVALRERAFFSSQVESVRFLQRALDAIDDFSRGARETMPDGETVLKTGSRAAFVDQMREFAMREGMGPLEPGLEGGLRDITSEKRLGLIFNTQTQQADDYGYWRQGMQADVLNEFPAQRFIRVQKVKQERESHIPYEDQVYLKTDPIWAKVINHDFGVPWGPWGWGCGHDVEDVDRKESEDLGLVKPGEQLQPDVKSFNENLQASTVGLEPELLAKLQQDLGEQLVIEGESMRWAGSEVATPAPVPTPAPIPAPLVPTTEVILPGGTRMPGPVDRTNQSPVSESLALKVVGALKEKVNAALSAIDKVHDDGVLPKIPLSSTRKSMAGALELQNTMSGMVSQGIVIQPAGPWPSLTTAHEVGHFLDLEAIGPKGRLATRAGYPGMLQVLAVAENSEAIRTLRQALATTVSAAMRRRLNYLLKPEEIWARAYAQFIAERSGAITLRNDLAKAVSRGENIQWATEDYRLIAEAIEKLFKQLGWM